MFQNYLDAKKLAIRDVLETCITKMMDGTYTCPGQRVAHLHFCVLPLELVLTLAMNEVQQSWFHPVCSYSGHGFTLCVHTAVIVSPCVFIQQSWFHHVCSYTFKLEGNWREVEVPDCKSRLGKLEKWYFCLTSVSESCRKPGCR